jgi:SNF2 family DNA or RNA helicase
MPDKVITPMYQKLSHKELYNMINYGMIILKKKLQGKKSIETQKDLVELILLRQYIASISIPYTIDIAENAIEMGHKVIIFTSFTEELETIQEHFGKLAVKHNGLMTTKMKQKSVDAFQENPRLRFCW